MADIDEKVVQYTLQFSRKCKLDVDEHALRDNIYRHLEVARSVVTEATLERIGHVHLSVMINTAARYNLSLAEVMMEAVRAGSQPVAPLCVAVETRKNSVTRVKQRPSLRVVK
ncbi:hypothetical protein [Stutzerimonas stutzeri]|uniref:Uncharacterized protein n=1 Tax=Stutzerimonas stutzeri TaxID=316 RepID=A0AA42TH32_STUST|nr:hypothetical protein [Stutzerimonas stutzeri]MDH1237269.1 hypothetical protein [Stutzerimonas stutzeri]MDH1556868.1 hypothetical protein [Stutzerimonas stutzeri]OCX57245.1 hypothetical protein BFM99_14335 [Stutzerimonas stutzeri]